MEVGKTVDQAVANDLKVCLATDEREVHASHGGVLATPDLMSSDGVAEQSVFVVKFWPEITETVIFIFLNCNYEGENLSADFEWKAGEDRLRLGHDVQSPGCRLAPFVSRYFTGPREVDQELANRTFIKSRSHSR